MTNKKNNNDNVESEKNTAVNTDEPQNKDASSVSNKNAKETIETPKSAQPVQETATKFEEKQGKRGVKLGIVAIVLSIVFGGGLTYHLQKKDALYQAQIDALRTQLEQTQSSLSSDLAATEQATIKKATEVTHHAETILAQQQKSIESLQLAISDVKGRRPNDWLLAEADYLVKLAGRKLFLEHDAETATLLMESADQRIASLNDPSLVPLRKLMAQDITTLKTIPIIDRDGLVLRLTALQQQVDNLPLANAILPEEVQEQTQEVSQDINDWQDNLKTSLKDFSENFITFRSRDGNIIPLLSPQQHFYLKENMKAKLETAIKAVYLEQQEVYTGALDIAEQWTQSFFDADSNAVKEFDKALTELNQQNVQVDYPIKLATQQTLSDVIRDRLRREVTILGTEGK
ncbi:uroporphyrinogen-III C-methyltransferase [Vibrio renipiscarius]|uniref:Uroporphyrin-III methyltransferase n=1 Tax=Vibrio renipiscarius TaxID=1461322 RepID=A0A0C2KDN2_9VIBR|nr:uroporphyrinogen-III C-methyltransferase [Vibrio renipiscarius]KII80248.1 uroporphyrin-III methyltransferase [Vibrio renipiscarius]KII82486.1 uroporphyrin-III methyltransferase [Vibrio renipiscarius]